MSWLSATIALHQRQAATLMGLASGASRSKCCVRGFHNTKPLSKDLAAIWPKNQQTMEVASTDTRGEKHVCQMARPTERLHRPAVGPSRGREREKDEEHVSWRFFDKSQQEPLSYPPMTCSSNIHVCHCGHLMPKSRFSHLLLSSPGRTIKGSGSAFVTFFMSTQSRGISFTSTVCGRIGSAQRSQDQRLSFLGQLGGRTPDDPCQTPRNCKPLCWGVGGFPGGPIARRNLSQGPWVSSPLHGKLWTQVPVQQSVNLMNLSQVGYGKGGNTKLLPETILRPSPLRTFACPKQNDDTIPSGSRSWHCFVICSHWFLDADPSPSLLNCPLASPPLVVASVFAHLQMWPPNRLVRPPPCCVKGVRTRKRRCSHLQRSGWSCWD